MTSAPSSVSKNLAFYRKNCLSLESSQRPLLFSFSWSSAGRQLQGWSSLRPKSLSPLPGSDINMSLNVCESSRAAVLRLLWASYLPKSPLSQNPLCLLLNADPSLAFRMAICPLLPSSLTLGLVPKLL